MDINDITKSPAEYRAKYEYEKSQKGNNTLNNSDYHSFYKEWYKNYLFRSTIKSVVFSELVSEKASEYTNSLPSLRYSKFKVFFIKLYYGTGTYNFNNYLRNKFQKHLNQFNKLTGLNEEIILTHLYFEIKNLTLDEYDLMPLSYDDRFYNNYTRIKNLKILEPLKNLSCLNLRGQDIFDLKGIENFQKLKIFILDSNNKNWIDGTQIKNIKLLNKLNNLKYLSLANNKVYELNDLKNENIEFLNLTNTPIEDFSFLKTTKNIKYLNLQGTGFGSFEGIEVLEKLETLCIGKNYSPNNIDFSPLQKLKNLKLLIYDYPSDYSTDEERILKTEKLKNHLAKIIKCDLREIYRFDIDRDLNSKELEKIYEKRFKQAIQKKSILENPS